MVKIINNARLKQRSLIITLLDLKNAFGEVYYYLVSKVLKYHHIPPQIMILVKSLYRGFQTSIITSDFTTPYITVERGVLQGGCLGPYCSTCVLILSFSILDRRKFANSVSA